MSKKIIGITVGTNFDKQKLKELVPDKVPIEKVDAKNVVFTEKIETDYAVGSISLVNGKGVLAEENQTLFDVLKKIYTLVTYPTTTYPKVTVTLTNAGEPLPTSGAYEVGTTFTPTYSAKFENGSYKLSGETIDSGVVFEKWSIKDTNNKNSESELGSLPSFDVTEDTNYRITATATHSKGIVPQHTQRVLFPKIVRKKITSRDRLRIPQQRGTPPL